jgi:putative DNA primase/helicase
VKRRYEEAYRIAGEEPARNGHNPKLRNPHTDLGLSERFVDEHGERVRYCPPWGKWLVYDGGRWVPDETGEVERLMKATVMGIYAEAAKEDDDAKRKALIDYARRSESAKRISDALRLARSEPDIPVLPRQLDADPWALNVLNGTIDLRTEELREHRRGDLITKLAPVSYDPYAKAPTFEAFLARLLPSEALRRFVQRVIGYAASGVVSEEILVILYGVGANGKSTLSNVVMEALGDYAMQAAPDLLMAKKGAHPTELADLFGARFVTSVETDEGRRLAEGLVKQLTGRDRIKARRMREDFWEYDPTHTVFLATNHRPEVKGTDHAIWRRLKLVPFEVTIPEAEQDKKLPEKLRAELPGVLAWIVAGCRQWQQRGGLGEPEEVKAATTSYRADMDILAGFIEDRCVVEPDAWAKFSDLYGAYTGWCDEVGEKAETKRRFGTRLKERGFEPGKGTDNISIRRGIGLRDDRHPDPEGGFRVIREPENYPTDSDDNPDRYWESGEEDYPNYPESGMNGKNPSHGGLYESEGNSGNSGNSVGGSDLTEDQDRRYRKLVREGMKESWALKEVLAQDHPLSCECEVCA